VTAAKPPQLGIGAYRWRMLEPGPGFENQVRISVRNEIPAPGVTDTRQLPNSPLEDLSGMWDRLSSRSSRCEDAF